MKIFFRLAILIVFTVACKKEKTADSTPDIIKPVITLKGKANDTIGLNSTYTDPGATAMDNVDGDISSKITVVGTVDKGNIGGNYIYYSVSDVAGNTAQTSRYVYVRNEAYKFVGSYNVVSSCGGSFNGLNSTADVAVSTIHNNRITISNQQFQSSGFAVTADVNGTSLTMVTQPIGSSLGSGTGTVAADGKSFTLTTTYTPAIQGSNGCTIVYTKQ